MLIDDILARLPAFRKVVDETGADFLAESPYFAVGRLYDFAIAACGANRTDVVQTIGAIVEDSLMCREAVVVDAFSINFIEALYLERNEPHFECISRVLGPASLADLASKAQR